VDIEPQRVSPSGGVAPQPEAAPTVEAGGGNGAQSSPTTAAAPPPPPAPEANGKQAAPRQPPPADGKRVVDFVCEDDVRRAIQKGEKIYTNARTIITPAARDMGEAAEVFAKA
jgi:hypothetical protein